MRIRISLSVTTDDQEHIARAVESMARTAAGLALEGIETFVMATPDEDE